jgi:hypothetical protein
MIDLNGFFPKARRAPFDTSGKHKQERGNDFFIPIFISEPLLMSYFLASEGMSDLVVKQLF